MFDFSDLSLDQRNGLLKYLPFEEVCTQFLEWCNKHLDPDDVFTADQIKGWVVGNFDPDEVFSKDKIIKWVASNLEPDDVFSSEVLSALAGGDKGTT